MDFVSRRFGRKGVGSNFGGVSNSYWNEETKVPRDFYENPFPQNEFQSEVGHGYPHNGGSQIPGTSKTWFHNEGSRRDAEATMFYDVGRSAELVRRDPQMGDWTESGAAVIGSSPSWTPNSILGHGRMQPHLKMRDSFDGANGGCFVQRSHDEPDRQFHGETRNQFQHVDEDNTPMNWVTNDNLSHGRMQQHFAMRDPSDGANGGLQFVRRSLEEPGRQSHGEARNQFQHVDEDNTPMNWVTNDNINHGRMQQHFGMRDPLDAANGGLQFVRRSLEEPDSQLNWETRNQFHHVNEETDNTHMNWERRNTDKCNEYVNLEPAGSYISEDNRPVSMIVDNQNLNLNWKRRNGSNFNSTFEDQDPTLVSMSSGNNTNWINNNIHVAVYNERCVKRLERTRFEVHEEQFFESVNTDQQDLNYTTTPQFYQDEINDEENHRVTRTSVNDSPPESLRRKADRKFRSPKSRLRTSYTRTCVTEISVGGVPSSSNDVQFNRGDFQGERMSYPYLNAFDAPAINSGKDFVWIKRNDLELEYHQGPDFNTDMRTADFYPSVMLHNYQLDETMTETYPEYNELCFEEQGPGIKRLKYTQKPKKKKNKMQADVSPRVIIEPIRKCHVQANQLLYIYFEQAILGFCGDVTEEQIREKFQQLWIEFIFAFFKRFWATFGFEVKSDSSEFTINVDLLNITGTKTVRERFDEIEVRHPSYQYVYFCKSTNKISEVLQRDQFSKKLFNALTPMLLESIYMQEAVGFGLTDSNPKEKLKIKCSAQVLQDLRQIPGKCATQIVLNFDDETDPAITCIKRIRRCRFLSMMFEKLGRKYANRQIKNWLWACTDFEKESFNSTLALLKKRGKTPQKWKRFRRKWRLEGRERTVRDLIYGAAAVETELGDEEYWTDDDVEDSELETSFPAANSHIRFPENDDDDESDETNVSQFIDPALLCEDENDIEEAVKNVMSKLISDVDDSIPVVEFVATNDNSNKIQENTLILNESQSNCFDETEFIPSVQGDKDLNGINLGQANENDEEASLVLDNIIENVVQMEALDCSENINLLLNCC
ncbi:unnamed protein product [Orchesella dallaii]|uniref:Uncharacterized protein n=1 Tax=Orchesella dallaii TaxID=48710 RepID=A0ABP1RDG1_9HEXA